MSIRKSTFSDKFYPNDKNELEKYFEHFNNILKQYDYKSPTKEKPKAIIAPHAGYIFSGFSANIAYSIAKEHQYKRAIVIGPSHQSYFDGIKTNPYDEYETPLGNLSIDMEYLKGLKDEYNITCKECIDCSDKLIPEHSTETQMPFIKHYLDIAVIELIYANYESETLSKLISHLIQDSDNLVIISTDLSHFYDKQKANQLDSICLESIEKLDLEMFDSGCEACGAIGVKALMMSAKEINAKIEITDYRTSCDANSDESSVVGYASAICY
jgi:AmmeMemoRadiSam system protein B